MPVLVTGAETAVGRTVATQLARDGEVRVFLDLERAGAANPAPFHALGCKVARGALDDEGHLESALEQVHTVMHLASSPLQDPGLMLDAAATVLSAAIGAGCRRVIWLSQLGAEAPEGNDYLAACAEVEDMLAEAPLESVVFRPSLTYGPQDDLTAALAGSTANGGEPSRHAPLYASDLAEAVAAVDRERVIAGPADLHVIVPIAGPDVLRLAEVIQGLRDSAPVTRPGRSLPKHVTDLLARDLLPPAGAIGAHGTSFSEGTRLLAAAWAS